MEQLKPSTQTPLSSKIMALLSSILSWPSLLSLFFLLAIVLLNHKKKSGKLPPGPRMLPIIGNLHQLTSAPHRAMTKLAREHGPLMYLQLGCLPHVIVSNAECAEEVMKTKDLETASRPEMPSRRKLTYNYKDLVFAPYGEYWRHMRKISTLELFTVKRAQSFRPDREEEVAKMIETISQSSKKGGVVNLSELTMALTNNVTCRIALGRSHVVEAQKTKFQRLIKEAQAMFAGFFVGDHFPMFGWVDVLTGMSGRLEKVFNEFDRFYESVIDEHISAKKDASEQEDFIDVLLRVQKDFNLTRDHIKGVLMDIFIGGTDTSASVMVWVMTELVRNKRVMIKAQEEVRRVVGSKGRVEENDIKHLHYLSAIMKESLRLHPPAPVIHHAATKNCNLGGYEVEAKTSVLINIYAIGRDPQSWENPEEFLPERFLESSIDYKGQHYQLLPFGSGRRICPGMHIGVSIVELTLASLLYSFNWDVPADLAEQVMDLNETTGITVHKKHSLLLEPTVYSV